MKFSENGLKDMNQEDETETYLYNGKKEETAFQTRLDLFRGDENKIKGFKVYVWDKVFECVITNKPSIDIRKTSEEEKFY